jgi:hypothetical protein
MKIISRIKSALFYKRKLKNEIKLLRDVICSQQNDLKSAKINLGQIQSYLNSQRQQVKSLREVEFQVFSQWGDDGIIQYLIGKLAIPHKVFIEFGVENYKESNTRFLLINNKWSGLVMDSSKANIDFIKHDVVSWSNDLHIRQSFITAENINGLITEFLDKGYPPEIGILSIDIDGNDYYVWKSINVLNPVMVIAEYNAVFGDEKPWTIPYDPDFYRLDNDDTYVYYGASLKSLCLLADQKGYYFIGCNSNGNNAYFVRKDKIGELTPLTCKDGYIDASFREYADKSGSRVGGKDRINLIRGRKVYNVENNILEII